MRRKLKRAAAINRFTNVLTGFLSTLTGRRQRAASRIKQGSTFQELEEHSLNTPHGSCVKHAALTNDAFIGTVAAVAAHELRIVRLQQSERRYHVLHYRIQPCIVEPENTSRAVENVSDFSG